MIGLILATIHSISIVQIVGISRLILGKEAHPALIGLSTSLSLSSVVFWHQIGSSFTDIFLTILILGGLYHFIRQLKSDKKSDLIISAVLFGVATGLKPTAGVYAVAIACCTIIWFLIIRQKFGKFILFGIVGVASTLITIAPWTLQVWNEFENPFFPFFNNVFKSSFYIEYAITYNRFSPDNFLDALLFPFKLVLPVPGFFYELRAPDVRFAIAIVLGFILFISKGRSLSLKAAPALLYVFFVVAWVLWLYSSSNARYGLPLLMLAGVLLTHQLNSFTSNKRVILYGGIILFLQILITTMSSSERWDSRQWGEHYFDIAPDETMLSDPALYVSISNQTNSFSFQRGSS